MTYLRIWPTLFIEQVSLRARVYPCRKSPYQHTALAAEVTLSSTSAQILFDETTQL